MSPIAGVLIWLFHKNLDIPKDINVEIPWTFIVLYFIFTSIFWINSLISYSRLVFCSEEKVSNV